MQSPMIGWDTQAIISTRVYPFIAIDSHMENKLPSVFISYKCSDFVTFPILVGSETDYCIIGEQGRIPSPSSSKVKCIHSPEAVTEADIIIIDCCFTHPFALTHHCFN